MQIKGNKQLEELKKSAELMLDKFDKHEEYHKEKEIIVNSLHCEVSFLKERIVLEKSEQCSHRNCFRVHGIEEQEQENADNIILNVSKDHLEMEFSFKDFDRSPKAYMNQTKSNIY